MPYRINPKAEREVQVKKGEEWMLLKEHNSADQARRHLRALTMNVSEARK